MPNTLLIVDKKQPMMKNNLTPDEIINYKKKHEKKKSLPKNIFEKK